jgi:hypothetical protein
MEKVTLFWAISIHSMESIPTGIRPRSRPSRRTDPCLGEHIQNQLVHLQDIAKIGAWWVGKLTYPSEK